MNASCPPIQFTIGVTGLNATDNPGPGISIIRSLRHAPGFRGRIVGLVYDTLEPGVYARDLLDSVFLIPYPSQGVDALFQRLLYVREKTGLDMVLPSLDTEIPAFIALQAGLRKAGIHSFLPSQEQYELRSKAHLGVFAYKLGIRMPRSRVVRDVETLYSVERELSCPLVIKGPFYGAEVARDVGEVVQAFHRTTSLWGLPVIIQEFIEGEEYDVAALADGTGSIIGSLHMKKMFLTDKGKGWAGVVINDQDLLQFAEDVLAALTWRGPSGVEPVHGVAHGTA